MQDFYDQYFGSVDKTVIVAVAVLTTILTGLVASLCNLETWWGHKNPLYHQNTDSLMPVIAALQGTAYGVWLGPAPGFADNFKSAILYGAASALMYFIIQQVVKMWPGTPRESKP